MTPRFLLLPFLAVALGACTAPPAAVPAAPVAVAATQPLALPVGTTWAWQRFEEPDGRAVVPADPSRYTLTLMPDGTAQLLLDCNRGGSRYRVTGADLAFEAIASTKMACPAGSLDTVFARALGQVRSWRIDGDALVLRLASGGSMRFLKTS